MIALVFLLSLIMTLVQKYTTDQKELKQLKKEQKELQKKINELKEDPQKMMEVQKELLPLTNKQMKLSMRTIMYTGIPLVFLFRWFNDYFISAGNPKILGMSWFIFYLIFSMVFSIILKKKLDVV